ncbi:MAG: hypothetical protein Q4G14_06010 [Paracoccus sp. (in: a-proteobacteria)]|uniref:hypothetical protein n=1 Tax=Paracoccus sp. TaxID=267 RepID=UPI0026DF2AD8|nr:hypothetical protein [Paracoccus sp. (in: a-proteobacteria)]MDO5612784.1 hypothetical protein [Paracoccus sp. (in: a-proteobacteria)]
MLNAILRSKSGRLRVGDEISISWRELFRANEDLVSATILERLSYLTPATAWTLLVEAASGQLPFYRTAQLNGIDFWPIWATDNRQRGVEPDAFIQLELGDPAIKMHIIVEAKRGGHQNLGQWANEIGGWVENTDDEMPDHLVLLALGGNADTRQRDEMRQQFLSSMRAHHSRLPKLSLAMIEWHDIARACTVLTALPDHEKRIVADIAEGLALCGHYHLVTPRQLEKLKPLRFPDASLNKLTAINERIARQSAGHD